MHFSIFGVALLSFYAPSILAAYDYVTKSSCITEFGSEPSSSIPTSSYSTTISITLTSKETLTPTLTIIPGPVTTTVATTVTVSTVSVIRTTSTTTTTTTSRVTYTISTSTISTGTVIVTISSSTATIPTPVGFTPIISGAGFVPRKRFEDRNPPKLVDRGAQDRASSSPHYPSRVICGTIVIIRTTTTQTLTASMTKTTTLPTGTTTVTSITITTTVTRISSPVVTTLTQTISATTFTTQTITRTSTVTQTATVAAATFYAACAANNIISTAKGGQKINSIGYGGAAQSYAGNLSPYECCARCQVTPFCVGSYVLTGSCTLFTQTVCDATRKFLEFSTAAVFQGEPYTISSGPCGQYGLQPPPS